MIIIQEANSELIKMEADNVILEFGSPTCCSCKMLSQTFDKLVDKVKKDVYVLLVNVMEYPEIAQRYQVMTLPTVVFINNGAVTESFTGAISDSELMKKINEYSKKCKRKQF